MGKIQQFRDYCRSQQQTEAFRQTGYIFLDPIKIAEEMPQYTPDSAYGMIQAECINGFISDFSKATAQECCQYKQTPGRATKCRINAEDCDSVEFKQLSINRRAFYSHLANCKGERMGWSGLNTITISISQMASEFFDGDKENLINAIFLLSDLGVAYIDAFAEDPNNMFLRMKDGELEKVLLFSPESIGKPDADSGVKMPDADMSIIGRAAAILANKAKEESKPEVVEPVKPVGMQEVKPTNNLGSDHQMTMEELDEILGVKPLYTVPTPKPAAAPTPKPVKAGSPSLVSMAEPIHSIPTLGASHYSDYQHDEMSDEQIRLCWFFFEMSHTRNYLKDGYIHPSMEDISSVCHVEVKAVDEGIEFLEEKGLITVTRPNSKLKRMTANEYRIDRAGLRRLIVGKYPNPLIHRLDYSSCAERKKLRAKRAEKQILGSRTRGASTQPTSTRGKQTVRPAKDVVIKARKQRMTQSRSAFCKYLEESMQGRQYQEYGVLTFSHRSIAEAIGLHSTQAGRAISWALDCSLVSIQSKGGRGVGANVYTVDEGLLKALLNSSITHTFNAHTYAHTKRALHTLLDDANHTDGQCVTDTIAHTYAHTYAHTLLHTLFSDNSQNDNELEKSAAHTLLNEVATDSESVDFEEKVCALIYLIVRISESPYRLALASKCKRICKLILQEYSNGRACACEGSTSSDGRRNQEEKKEVSATLDVNGCQVVVTGNCSEVANLIQEITRACKKPIKDENSRIGIGRNEEHPSQGCGYIQTPKSEEKEVTKACRNQNEWDSVGQALVSEEKKLPSSRKCGDGLEVCITPSGSLEEGLLAEQPVGIDGKISPIGDEESNPENPTLAVSDFFSNLGSSGIQMGQRKSESKSFGPTAQSPNPSIESLISDSQAPNSPIRKEFQASLRDTENTENTERPLRGPLTDFSALDGTTPHTEGENATDVKFEASTAILPQGEPSANPKVKDFDDRLGSEEGEDTTLPTHPIESKIDDLSDAEVPEMATPTIPNTEISEGMEELGVKMGEGCSAQSASLPLSIFTKKNNPPTPLFCKTPDRLYPIPWRRTLDSDKKPEWPDASKIDVDLFEVACERLEGLGWGVVPPHLKDAVKSQKRCVFRGADGKWFIQVCPGCFMALPEGVSPQTPWEYGPIDEPINSKISRLLSIPPYMSKRLEWFDSEEPEQTEPSKAGSSKQKRRCPLRNQAYSYLKKIKELEAVRKYIASGAALKLQTPRVNFAPEGWDATPKPEYLETLDSGHRILWGNASPKECDANAKADDFGRLLTVSWTSDDIVALTMKDFFDWFHSVKRRISDYVCGNITSFWDFTEAKWLLGPELEISRRWLDRYADYCRLGCKATNQQKQDFNKISGEVMDLLNRLVGPPEEKDRSSCPSQIVNRGKSSYLRRLTKSEMVRTWLEGSTSKSYADCMLGLIKAMSRHAVVWDDLVWMFGYMNARTHSTAGPGWKWTISTPFDLAVLMKEVQPDDDWASLMSRCRENLGKYKDRWSLTDRDG